MQITLQRRALHIDFDLYTEGDKEFKKELTQMLIKNINEFKQALCDSVAQNSPDIFFKAYHKVKVALVMLADQEFLGLSEALERKIINRDMIGNSFTAMTKLCESLCDSITYSLESEIKGS